jgi:hypothetical protein
MSLLSVETEEVKTVFVKELLNKKKLGIASEE